MSLTPGAVRAVTFDKAPFGKRGYHEDQVDDFLDRVEAALAGAGALTADEVRNVVFDAAPLVKRGYHEDQVDAFLDEVVAEVERRELAGSGDTEPIDPVRDPAPTAHAARPGPVPPRPEPANQAANRAEQVAPDPGQTAHTHLPTRPEQANQAEPVVARPGQTAHGAPDPGQTAHSAARPGQNTHVPIRPDHTTQVAHPADPVAPRPGQAAQPGHNAHLPTRPEPAGQATHGAGRAEPVHRPERIAAPVDSDVPFLPLPPSPPGERGYRPADVDKLARLLARAAADYSSAPTVAEVAAVRLGLTFFVGQGYHQGTVDAVIDAWTAELRRREA
ncbi:DivIVA domain-containing protein [Actinokineospora sp.]|uniref:DivIVA domain-containing protein n=1 Tax=Actinokineospora sp. TaxID=1872133 RepID=UPI00403779D4